MKKIFAILIAASLSASTLLAKETIKFMGIPVTGSEKAMQNSLREKGFEIIDFGSEGTMVRGQFNGKNSFIHIHTNKGQVDRLIVTNVDYVNEESIMTQFNRLLGQFQKKANYIEMEGNKTIDYDEDISYEMSVHNKSYEAGFYPIDEEGNIINGMVWFKIFRKGNEYYIGIFYDNLDNMADGEDL